MSRGSVIHFLTHGASQRIEFSFASTTGRTIEVNRTTFQRVADGIRSGRIILLETTQFSAGVGAEYSGQADSVRKIAANTMRIRPGIGRIEQSQLLHESVHASFDLTFSNGIPWSEEEATCYIAEVLYCRRTGVPFSRAIFDDIRRAANSIVNTLLSNEMVTSSHRQPISAAQIAALTGCVRRHPVYAQTNTSLGATGGYAQDG
jgi:hypothetical protein